jgi:hypothetical protein
MNLAATITTPAISGGTAVPLLIGIVIGMLVMAWLKR